MALALRVPSAPSCATAYRPRSRRMDVVRAGNRGGFWNHAGITRIIAPSPFGKKEWAGTDSGFAGQVMMMMMMIIIIIMMDFAVA
ncbi:hypothetical protein FOA52_003231 [Chlamydomonas sp. UWO 241]|nr:hypothetical protein FOA52_003231 [Chlamydomonas sp. UWO 241]